MPILKQIEKKLDLNFFQKQVPLKNKSKIFKNALKKLIFIGSFLNLFLLFFVFALSKTI